MVELAPRISVVGAAEKLPAHAASHDPAAHRGVIRKAPDRAVRGHADVRPLPRFAEVARIEDPALVAGRSVARADKHPLGVAVQVQRRSAVGAKDSGL